MSMLRITQRHIGEQTLAGLQRNLGRVGMLQQQLSSGRLISKPSDDPSGTVSAMQYRSEVRTHEQWARNGADGVGWLGTIDSTLTTSLNSVRRVRELALAGSNTGAVSPQSREALAEEVRQLRQNLLDLANTTYNGQPVFGGTTAGGKAYDLDGRYVGEPQAGAPVEIRRTVGDGRPVRVDVTGREVFGEPADGDLFAVVDRLAANLVGNPAGLGQDLEDLDVAMKRIQSELAGVGARYGRVDQMRVAAEDRVLVLRGSLAEVESIDLPKTIVELQMQQVAYEAALGATKRVITPSLVEFLR